MAWFYDYDLAHGWWMYFEMRYCTEEPEFRVEFEEELTRLIEREGKEYDANDSKQERVSMHKMRGKIY